MFYSGHPTITHKDYNDQYLVDTRNGRDSVPRKYKKRVKEEESDEEGSAIWEEKPAVKRKPAAKPSGLTITPLPSASKKTKDEDLWKPKGWNQGSDEEEEESPRYCIAIILNKDYKIISQTITFSAKFPGKSTPKFLKMELTSWKIY